MLKEIVSGDYAYASTCKAFIQNLAIFRVQYYTVHSDTGSASRPLWEMPNGEAKNHEPSTHL